jgi:spore coat polysaccharide biosynthesis predicted glycosyltransferase SpsG
MKIAFITEASTKIGYGHLYRSIALAQEFISKNLEIDFFCDGKTAIEIIKKHLPKTNIYQTSELSLIIQEYNLLIIDVYKSSWSTYEWLTQLSDLKTASIIDYAFKEYSIPTDFIFQIGFQEYSFKETSHQNENGKISKVYSGNDFFIFREEFKKARTFEVRKDAKKILVSMGGSDPYKLTELVSESLVEIHKPLIITLIFGAEINEKRLSTINSIFSNSVHDIQIFKNVSNIGKLMANNDFAIINGGNTRFELALLGIPFISVSINVKQSEISDFLQSAGIGYNLGIYNKLSTKKISKYISDFVSNFELRERMSLTMKEKIRYNIKETEILLNNELFL